MALNITRPHADRIDVKVTHPEKPKSGDVVRWGDKVGVALADPATDTGLTPVQFSGTAVVPVKAVDGEGDSAINPGDSLYYTDGDTPALSKKDTGKLAGHAMETVTAGSEAEIEIRLAG